MYYLIKEQLEECKIDDIHTSGYNYVAILSTKEWEDNINKFEFGIDMDLNVNDIHNTKAEVNFDSLTGTFLIPDRNNLIENEFAFAFALDEKGIVFIDDGDKALDMVTNIKEGKRWKEPCLERFIYDFLESILKDDLVIIEKYERELNTYEDLILENAEKVDMDRVNDIRGDIRELSVHYEQLIDLAQEFCENENSFFKSENERYFKNFLGRLSRHNDMLTALKDYTVQVRDLYHTQLDVRQNRIMTLLTVVTTIFMPLTLIVGWYGMNFKYMPELGYKYAYPIVILVSVVIAVGSLVFFKFKKWL